MPPMARQPRPVPMVAHVTPDAVAVLLGVGVVRDGRWILSGVDWTIRPGERWVVLGPNGSGKTTLLEILSTYLYPSAGSVTILGERHGHTDVRLLRRRIGYASAHLARMLDTRLTALEAVVTARTAALHPGWDRFTLADVRRARDLLRSVGSEQFAGHMLGTLSEGERQRVQIARALMSRPELLLLDEVSAGLDLGARERIVRRLAALAADPASPVIVFVTHHVEEIPRHFTHALLLREGRPFELGPIDEALTEASLSGCFGLPVTLERRGGRFAARGADRHPGDSGRRSDTEPRRRVVVGADGRAKALRPIPPRRRIAALDAGLDAFGAGEYFEAHELLEPAWMGARDPLERDLYQGLIKVAAAGVHAWRRNPQGVRKNLEGARQRLAAVASDPALAGAVAQSDPLGPRRSPAALRSALARVDVAATLRWVEDALSRPSALPDPGDFRRAIRHGG